jgi:phage shock protein A
MINDQGQRNLNSHGVRVHRLSWRGICANLNRLIGQTEDPKILEQALVDRQGELLQMRQAVAQAIASLKRTECRVSKAESTAREWYNRAQHLALSKGDENLAQEALTQRQTHQQTAQALQAQLGQQREIVTKLKKDMRTLEARWDQASAEINEMLGNIYTGKIIKAFERMENKVLKLEYRVEAIAEPSSGDELS